MSNEKWLQNEPQSWHYINRALQDISLVLAYLGTLPEGRLLSFFDDTQGKISASATKTTLPPCSSYTEFLNRITEAYRQNPDLKNFQYPPEVAVTLSAGTAQSQAGIALWIKQN